MTKAEISVSEIRGLLKSAWIMRDSMSVGLLGSPGIGKTQEVYRFCDWVRENTEFKNSKVVEYILSQALPSEISGITMPDSKEQELVIYDHRKLTSLKDGDILFLDEFLEAPEQVRKACLTLIQERRMMSGRKLPDVMIIAASNPTPPNRISMAQRERFKWFFVKASKDEWATWASNKFSIETSELKKCLTDIGENIDSDFAWNFQTPRSISMMVDWYQRDQEALAYITELYGVSVADAIVRACKVKTPKQQIIDGLNELSNQGDINFKIDVLDIKNKLENRTIDLNEAGEMLAKIDVDGVIEKYFSNIELEEVTNDKEIIRF